MNNNVTQITDHVQQALDRLLQQYKGRPRMQGLITALVNQIQDLENAIFPVGTETLLFNGQNYIAKGAQLDGIGELVNVARNGLGDDEYLILILGTIGVNFSDTTGDTMTGIIKELTQAQDVTVFDHYPAGYGVQVQAPSVPSGLWALIASLIQGALGAAIELCYIDQYDPSDSFNFSGGKVAGQGFANYSTVGGGGGNFCQPLWRRPSGVN